MIIFIFFSLLTVYFYKFFIFVLVLVDGLVLFESSNRVLRIYATCPNPKQKGLREEVVKIARLF
jgi:hypothetical protein